MDVVLLFNWYREEDLEMMNSLTSSEQPHLIIVSSPIQSYQNTHKIVQTRKCILVCPADINYCYSITVFKEGVEEFWHEKPSIEDKADTKVASACQK